jgi:TRAP-type mannitol/chloroaromatic compound transport system permease large subunit
MGVLGSIIAGIATPTEAAAIGAAGTIIMAAAAGKLNYSNLKEVVLETGKTSGMVLFVAIGATCFSVIFKRIGGNSMIEDTVSALSSGPYSTLAVVMILIFILGFFLEWIEISFLRSILG